MSEFTFLTKEQIDILDGMEYFISIEKRQTLLILLFF